MAVPFDPNRLELSGDSVPILQQIRHASPGSLDYSISASGTLAYVPGSASFEHDLVWVDRAGRETLVTSQKEEYGSSHISPDGKQAVFSIHSNGQPHSVWIYDFELDSLSRFSFEGSVGGAAVWSPDGEWIAYQANPDGKRNLYRQRADRSGQPERLTTSESLQMAVSWHPDGTVIAFHEIGVGTDIGIVSLEGDQEPQLILNSPASECCARFSPDGRWLAYVSNENGQDGVYVRSYPELDVQVLISGEEGGGEPVWSPDGRELFYRSGRRMMVVPVQTDPAFRAGRPEILFEGSYRGLNSAPAGYQYYDISQDGQQFLMVKPGQNPGQINVVLNWFEELKRLVPTE